MAMIQMYVEQMLGFILAITPVYVLLRLAYLKVGKKQTTWKRELLLGLCVAYGVGLLSQTILPPGQYYFERGSLYINPIILPERQFNLIPFATIRDYLFTHNDAVSNWTDVSILNLLANLFLFAPIGFLAPLVSRKPLHLKHVLILSLVVCVVIEFIQYFGSRSADIDDLILNVCGACLGYGLLVLWRKVTQKPGALNQYAKSLDSVLRND